LPPEFAPVLFYGYSKVNGYFGVKLMGILASSISTGFQLLGLFVPNTMNIYKLTVFLPIEENEVKNSSLESLF
jgi:hypothetical protein